MPPAGDAALGAAAGPEGESWLQPGARAILCNLAKFPKFNGQVVELASWNEEKQRWKCLLASGGDVQVFVSNLEPAEMQPDKVKLVEAMLGEGHVFEAWQAIQTKASVPQELKAAVNSHLVSGTYSEIVDGRLKLVAIPDKGMGYRAARPIHQGEVLLFAAGLVSSRLSDSREPEGPNMSRAEDPYYEMSKQISRAQIGEEWWQENVMCLPYIKVVDDRRSEQLRILENNSLLCTREPGYIAFFPAAARFNHSCCPNAFADSSRSTVVVRALRDIPEGEEVCISYVPVADTVAKRQEALTTCGFTCTCKRCETEGKCKDAVEVLCKCGKFSFSLDKAQRMYQTCEVCYASFNREESEHNLSKVTEGNKLLRTGGDPLVHVKKLEALEPLVRPGATDGAPPGHQEALFLVSNLAHLHYHLATRVKGDHTQKSLEAFHRYQKKVIHVFEEKHGNWTNQRDMTYLQVLYLSLTTPGLDEESKSLFAQRLADACRLCYGQPFLPELVAKRGR